MRGRDSLLQVRTARSMLAFGTILFNTKLSKVGVQSVEDVSSISLLNRPFLIPTLSCVRYLHFNCCRMIGFFHSDLITLSSLSSWNYLSGLLEVGILTFVS
jgi:hypothetical protein